MAQPNAHFAPHHTSQLKLQNRPEGDFSTAEEVIFHDSNNKVWRAPIGTITDGASIPGVFAGFFGGKLNREFFFAAIVHDAYCAEANTGGPVFQVESWQDTHLMFYDACIANGTSPTNAKVMYAGVRLGGPRWSLNGESFTDLSGVSEKRMVAEMQFCKDWIEANEDVLTIKDVDKWMEDREPFLLAS